jgi:predicted nucleic acid-binding protein
LIYVDASVVLAHLLMEERMPPPTLWAEQLTSSRLLQYEVWTVLNSRASGRALGDQTHAVLDRIDWIELEYDALERALAPFPLPLRTLDAMHVAAADYLRREGQAVLFATYDRRQLEVAQKLGFELAEL